MKKRVEIGIIGDFDPNRLSHTATVEAVDHAADRLSLNVVITWLPTLSLLNKDNLKNLDRFDCLWASAGSPYKSMEGALRGIRKAREMGKPFIGT